MIVTHFFFHLIQGMQVVILNMSRTYCKFEEKIFLISKMGCGVNLWWCCRGALHDHLYLAIWDIFVVGVVPNWLTTLCRRGFLILSIKKSKFDSLYKNHYNQDCRIYVYIPSIYSWYSPSTRNNLSLKPSLLPSLSIQTPAIIPLPSSVLCLLQPIK